VVARPIEWFKKHPVYVELQFAVSPAQFASLKRVGVLVLKDPLFVNREGVIIDGYARIKYAASLGISTLTCLEIDANEDEALRLILNKHRRSPGWNDYNRIRMASQLKGLFSALARANQQAGGRFKGSSKLTEASVRKAIADTAGVCEGNIVKVDQLLNSPTEILDALARGEIRIHRAWLWRGLNAQQQQEELRRYRLKRSLKQSAKIRVFKHRVSASPTVIRTSTTMSSLQKILNQVLSTPANDCKSSESIAIGLIKLPGKVALLTTELFEDLLVKGE
jgi:ParB-like chromosome segregation protein Spo0J